MDVQQTKVLFFRHIFFCARHNQKKHVGAFMCLSAESIALGSTVLMVSLQLGSECFLLLPELCLCVCLKKQLTEALCECSAGSWAKSRRRCCQSRWTVVCDYAGDMRCRVCAGQQQDDAGERHAGGDTWKREAT